MVIDEVQEPQQQQQPDPPIKKLYKVVKDKGLYTKSYDEFVSKYSTPEEVDKLHRVVTEQGLYTKSRQDFDAQYFPTPEKKNLGGNGSKDVSDGVSNGTTSTSEIPETSFEPLPPRFFFSNGSKIPSCTPLSIFFCR